MIDFELVVDGEKYKGKEARFYIKKMAEAFTAHGKLAEMTTYDVERSQPTP